MSKTTISNFPYSEQSYLRMQTFEKFASVNFYPVATPLLIAGFKKIRFNLAAHEYEILISKT